MKRARLAYLFLFFAFALIVRVHAQNTIVGDGFGARSWYKPSNFSANSYGGFFTCGPENSLYGWAYKYPQLITNDSNINAPITEPIPVYGLKNIKFHTGGYMAAAIKTNDSAYAWSRRFPPTPVLGNVKFADAGINMVAFIKFDGSLWLTYEDTNSLKTRSLPSIPNPVRVGVGWGVVYVLSSNGKVYCIENPISNPTVGKESLQSIIDIKLTSVSAAALDSGGRVFEIFYKTTGHPTSELKFPYPIIALSGQCDGYLNLFLSQNGNCYDKSAELIDGNVVEILCGEGHYQWMTNDRKWHDIHFYGEPMNLNWDSFPCQPDNPVFFSTQSFCLGDSVVYRDKSYHKAGLFEFTENDSFFSLTLSTKDTAYEYWQRTVCSSQPAPPKRERLWSYQNDSVCEAIFVDTVFVTIPTLKIRVVTCENSVSVRGITYFKDTTFSFIKKSKGLCDSVIDVDIQFFKSVDSSIIIGKCPGEIIQFNGQSYRKQGIYTSKLFNHLGCDSIRFTLLVQDSNCFPIIFIPDAFTPNNTGPSLNNTFLPHTDRMNQFHMQIFDRWGAKLFDSYDLALGWDGTYHNQPAQDGVYSYCIEVESLEHEHYSFSGTFTLIR